jgi:hypothetical protein
MGGWFIAREQRAQLLSEGSAPDPLDPKSDFLAQKYLLRCEKSICGANKSTIRDQKIFHRALHGAAVLRAAGVVSVAALESFHRCAPAPAADGGS